MIILTLDTGLAIITAHCPLTGLTLPATFCLLMLKIKSNHVASCSLGPH